MKQGKSIERKVKKKNKISKKKEASGGTGDQRVFQVHQWKEKENKKKKEKKNSVKKK